MRLEQRSDLPPRVTAAPIDWALVEGHYRAGVLSLAAIGKQHGVSAPGILKHMRKHGISRDLRRRILAKAEEKVHARLVNDRVNAPRRRAAEAEVVGATSELMADIALSHRSHLARLRSIAGRFITELECMHDAAAVLTDARQAVATMDPQLPRKIVRLADAMGSLPRRLDAMRKLVEIERSIISTERAILGLDRPAPGDSTGYEDLVDLATAALAQYPAQPSPAPVVPPTPASAPSPRSFLHR